MGMLMRGVSELEFFWLLFISHAHHTLNAKYNESEGD
jgi:hypothetical protein